MLEPSAGDWLSSEPLLPVSDSAEKKGVAAVGSSAMSSGLEKDCNVGWLSVKVDLPSSESLKKVAAELSTLPSSLLEPSCEVGGDSSELPLPSSKLSPMKEESSLSPSLLSLSLSSPASPLSPSTPTSL